MKKSLSSIFLMLLTLCVYSQEQNGIEQFIPSQTPDVAAFSKVNFLPISEYTGKPNISVPLYQIKLGSMSIPISVTYNYGGIKVDDVASSVGLGWSLNAGGNIVRQINGLHDLKPASSPSGYGIQGFLSDTQGADCSQYLARDGEPDFFFASAPGLNTKFIPKLNPTYGYNFLDINDYKLDAIDLNKQGNIIKMQAWRYNGNLNLHTNPNVFNHSSVDLVTYSSGLVSTKITNTQGFVYTFSDFSLNANLSQVTSWDQSSSQPTQPPRSDRFIDAQALTTIFDPITNSTVYFDYTLPYEQNQFWKVKGVFRPDGTIGSKNAQENFHKKRKLHKIRFKDGEIEFFYEFTRLDLPAYADNIALDNKALSKIVIKDKNGNIIKDIRFVYSNRQTVQNCGDPECYRLMLDEIYFADEVGSSNLPGYKFVYNQTDLPKRNSWISDFLGYWNGQVASPAPTTLGHYIPKTYHNPNSGKYSFLPFDIGNPNYTQLSGNFSLASNESHAKAMLLEKITYPTGGYTVLDSELNQFKILGQTVNGGGLRIKKQTIYDHDSSVQREIFYEYKKANGETSGSIVNLPRFNDYEIGTPGYNGQYNGLRIYQTQLANLKLTQSSFVGYSRVKVYETGNGYTIKNFTSPEDFPNTDATVSTPVNPNPRATLKVNNGTFPTMMIDADLFRGNLKEQAVHRQGGALVSKTINTYKHKRFESIAVSSRLINFDAINDAEGCEYAPDFMSQSGFVYVERNLHESSQSTSYNLDGSQITTTTTNYTYEGDYPFVREKSTINSDGTAYKTIYSYPYSNPQFTNVNNCEGNTLVRLPLIELTNNNMISTPFYIKEFKGSDLISNKLLLYKPFQYTPKDGGAVRNIANGIPILERSIINTSEILTKAPGLGDLFNCPINKDIIDVKIHLYDDDTNPIELSSSATSGHTLLIWGYNGKRLLAKIENATFDDVSGLVLSDIIIKSNADNDRTFGSAGNEGQLRIALDKLRDPILSPGLVGSQITTYTYDPLIGLTSMTNNRGKTIYYHYDKFNRLKNIKDFEGNILSENEYNYKN